MESNVEVELEGEWEGSSFDDDDNFKCCELMHFLFAKSFGKDFQTWILENWTLNVLMSLCLICSSFVMNMHQNKYFFKSKRILKISMLESSFTNVVQKYETRNRI
jgi:hypothetical protein